MKNKTIWLENINEDSYTKLNENISCDVIIIGGGITGMSCAYHLRKSNLKVCLIDRDLVGHGITSKTTAKLNYLQELIPYKINKYVSKSAAVKYIQSQIEAIKIVEEIIDKEKINCDLKKAPSFLFTNKKQEIKKIKKQKEILESMGIKVSENIKIPIKFDCLYSISVDDTAVFHPIKYLYKLKEICINEKIDIYEKTKIISIKKNNKQYICKTSNNNTITAKKVVVASHYPYFILPFFMPIKTSIEKSYVSASKIDIDKSYTAITSGKPVQSVRYYSNDQNNYIIYLNGSHYTCNNYNENKNFSKLKNDLKKLKLEPQYIWSNHDIITYDNMPFIGKIKNKKNSILIGTGYNTWGMTNGTLAGKILSDIILERKNKYETLFNPRRKNIIKIIKYLINLSFTAKSFIENKISKNKPWYNQNIVFKKRKGKNIAIYKNEKGEKHIVYSTCPHMGCSLTFNEEEKTWDCPCHGSRFYIDGKVMNGPANYDISYKKK